MNRLSIVAAAFVTLSAQAEMPIVQFTMLEEYSQICGKIYASVKNVGVTPPPGVLAGLLSGAQQRGASHHQLQMAKFAFQRGEMEVVRDRLDQMTAEEAANIYVMYEEALLPKLKQCSEWTGYAK